MYFAAHNDVNYRTFANCYTLSYRSNVTIIKSNDTVKNIDVSSTVSKSSPCLVSDQIIVEGSAALLSCTAVVQASDRTRTVRGSDYSPAVELFSFDLQNASLYEDEVEQKL